MLQVVLEMQQPQLHLDVYIDPNNLLLIQIICFGHGKKYTNQQHSSSTDRENDTMIQNETKQFSIITFFLENRIMAYLAADFCIKGEIRWKRIYAERKKIIDKKIKARGLNSLYINFSPISCFFKILK